MERFLVVLRVTARHTVVRVSHDPNKPYRTQTWCTTCDDTKPPSNCSKREQPMTVQDPGKDLSKTLAGGILKNPKGELPELQQSIRLFLTKLLQNQEEFLNYRKTVKPLMRKIIPVKIRNSNSEPHEKSD
jgi:hypothetical protein